MYIHSYMHTHICYERGNQICENTILLLYTIKNITISQVGARCFPY